MRSVVSYPQSRDQSTDILLMPIYQESEAKYRKSQHELEELEKSMQDL